MGRRYKKVLYSVISLAIILTIATFILVFRRLPLFRAANVIEIKIEDFKAKNGRLPLSLNEIGWSERGPVYYKVKGQVSYELWFHTEFGRLTYSSEKRTWQ